MTLACTSFHFIDYNTHIKLMFPRSSDINKLLKAFSYITNYLDLPFSVMGKRAIVRTRDTQSWV